MVNIERLQQANSPVLAKKAEKQQLTNGGLESSGKQETAPSQGQGNQIDYALIEEVRKALRIELELNGDQFANSKHYQAIMDESSPSVCWRYLKHCAFKTDETVELIKTALQWRKDNGLGGDGPSTRAGLVKEFWLLAPITFSGQSKGGQDVIFIIGRNYRKPRAVFRDTIRKFVLHTLFDWDERHRDDLEQLSVVFDVSDTGFRNIDLDFMAWLVSVLDYLPDRIHQVYVVGIPFLVRPLVRLVISWLPEKLSRLVHCGTHEQLIEANMERDQLPVEAGGLRSDERYRLAPADAPWASASREFTEPEMLKAMEECIGFSVDEERREKLRKMQLDHESHLAPIEETETEAETE